MFSLPMATISNLFAFGFSTAGESIYPGPTVGALISARTKGRTDAVGIVIGVTIANVAWVGLAFLAHYLLNSVLHWPYTLAILNAIAAGILVYLASRTSIGATVSVINSYILGDWTASVGESSGEKFASVLRAVRRGFAIHLFNPLSVTYYLGTYTTTIAHDPGLAIQFSMVAVTVDFAIYGAFAVLPMEKLLTPSVFTYAAQRILALLAGIAMLVLVTRVFAHIQYPPDQIPLPGLRNFAMLLGVLVGAIAEAEQFARDFGGRKKKVLWRSVLVWQSAFGSVAVIGTFLSVLMRIDPASFGLLKALQATIAICALVAAVLAAGFSYARARGEFLDEMGGSNSVAQSLTAISRERITFVNRPRFVFAFIIGCFALLGTLFFYSGFANP